MQVVERSIEVEQLERVEHAGGADLAHGIDQQRRFASEAEITARTAVLVAGLGGAKVVLYEFVQSLFRPSSQAAGKAWLLALVHCFVYLGRRVWNPALRNWQAGGD